MKKLSFAAAALMLLSVLVFYLSQDKDAKIKLRLEDNSYMDNVRIIQKKEGAVKWVLDAKKAVFLTANDIKLHSMKIFFPEKELVLTSNSGLYDVDNKSLKIEDNIKASTKDYDIVATTLFWDSSRNELLSDEQVHITGKRFSAVGDTMTATTDKAILNKNVKAVFYGK